MLAYVGSDPLTAEARARILAAPRPKRSLPLLSETPSSRDRPLAASSRPVDRATRPIYAVWELTLACDLSCRHCGSRAGSARPDELTTAEALDVVRQMAALGVKEVALIGGEVYLHEGWLDVVAEIRRTGMQSTIVTGGRGMTEERARAAASAGVQSVAVSIDGAEETHDRLRGVKGSWISAVNALRNLRVAGLQVAGNTQINRLNVRELSQVLDVLIDAGAHGWQVQLTVPVGRAADEPEVILQPYDLLELFPQLAALKARCDAAGLKMLAGNNVGYYGPYEHALRSYCDGKHGDACSAGKLTLGLESNGDVKGCPSLSTNAWVGGNVRTHSLKDIWERSTPLRHTRDRTVAELWGFCATCYYADACRAGCTWMTTSLFERPGNNPYCHHRALELRARGQRERVARTEEAPGHPFDHGRWSLVVEDLEARDDGATSEEP